MDILPILFWILVILNFAGYGPWMPTNVRGYVPGLSLFLICILGLRTFPINLH